MKDFIEDQKIKFVLDGHEVEALSDETIWQVAKRVGIFIPHLCYSEEKSYRADGNCRACMVEIDGERTLAASCIRKPTDGMVVKSNTKRAKSSRELVMELLVTDQPLLEEAHDKSSHFWEMAKKQDISASRFPKTEEEKIPILDDSHLAMKVNLDACIQCNLCVRACREVQVNDVIGLSDRGRHSKITFDQNDKMGNSTCVACGECVQICPPGALMPATVLDENQVGDRKDIDHETKSVCPFCGVGCQVNLKVKGNKIRYVDGINGPAN